MQQIVIRTRVCMSAMVAVALLVAAAADVMPQAGAQDTKQKEPVPIVGVDQSGTVHNQPKDWPSDAGNWNGKAARYHPETQTLVFQSNRGDIVGGSIVPEAGSLKAPGVSRVFIAGPGTGAEDRHGTAVLYVAGRNGEDPRGIGCEDIQDGKQNAAVYLCAPSTSETPHTPQRQLGGVVYANQNKDVPAWHPNGQWIFAAVEMKRHALKHRIGCGGAGFFCNLWAISLDGKTWVQLTDFEKTWPYYDPVAVLPYQAYDNKNCPTSARYATQQNQHPFLAYSASAPQQPPPASGIMRPTVGNQEQDGRVPIVWAERVGMMGKYTWGGPQQLAMAEIVFTGGLPALVHYRRNLTPTPAHPDGQGLWSNPGGTTVVGAGYEAWSFSKDDAELLIASDVFLSASHPAGKRNVSPQSEAFTDVIAWRWKGDYALWNATAYDPVVYPYQENGGPFPANYYGHWEEPGVYLLSQRRSDVVAFGSSASFVPPWNPMKQFTTFGQDVWLIQRDHKTPAKRITFFNRDNGTRFTAYPTATDPADDSLYLTVVTEGTDRTVAIIYKLPIPEW